MGVRSRSLVSVSGLVVALAPAQPVQGEQATSTSPRSVIATASPAQSTSSPRDSGQLEDIVVTAQKREQNLADVGISVSVLSGRSLVQLGIVACCDLGHSLADSLGNADAFISQHGRKYRPERARDDGQVAMANSHRLDVDQYFAGPRVIHGNRLDRERRVGRLGDCGNSFKRAKALKRKFKIDQFPMSNPNGANHARSLATRRFSYWITVRVA